MIDLTCAVARRHLQAYHDGELDVARRIAMQAHVQVCASCASESARLQALGDAIRAGLALRRPAEDDLTGLQPSVVGRMKAERDATVLARASRMFEDMHLVWAALGATAATIACVTVMLGLLQSASREHPGSLAALLASLAAQGTNQHPVRMDGRMLLPRAYPDAVMPAAVVNPGGEDVVFALAAVLTREGQIANLELLMSERARGRRAQDAQVILDLLDAASRARFEPAQAGGSPVAVNMVWLLAHTTVRGRLPAYPPGGPWPAIERIPAPAPKQPSPGDEGEDSSGLRREPIGLRLA